MNIVSPQLVAAAITLVKEAGKVILKCYQKEHIAFSLKSGDSVASPVTEADCASHQLIVDRLNTLEPRMPVLSEEAELPPYRKRKDWSAFWILDPLDGTKEFVSRNGEFTINLALVVDCKPILGIVHAPALGITYYSSPGSGALKEHEGQAPFRISVNNDSAARPKIVSSRSHSSAELEMFLSTIGDPELLKMGSSLKFCLVAEGAAHLYPRLGTTMEWDTAAGQSIVEAAGGAVTTLDGTPLAYNKEDLRNPHFVASNSPSGWWRALITTGEPVNHQS